MLKSLFYNVLIKKCLFWNLVTYFFLFLSHPVNRKAGYQTVPRTDFEINWILEYLRLLNASALITLWKLQVKANFVFSLLNVSLSSRAKALKNVSSICRIQFDEMLQNIFELGLKKYGVMVQTSLSEKIYSEIINSQTRFYFLYVKLATVQIWGQSNKFALTCSFQKVIRALAFRSCEIFDNSFYFKILGIIW